MTSETVATHRPVSICTLARGRDLQLARLLDGIRGQRHAPLEVLIGRMQPEPYELQPIEGVPVRQFHVAGERLPCAAARNRCADEALGEILVFLDVDCIPAPELVSACQRLADATTCLMGETRYLAGDEPIDGRSFETLWASAAIHPARDFVARFGPGARHLPSQREFWSLSFAMTRRRFFDIGGFDTGFDGYAGEDTDFGFRLQRSATALRWSPELRAVHQWHPVQVPPLDRFDDIVRNANRLKTRHGEFCMDYWLDQFAAAGYIRRGEEIEIVRRPSADERELARRPRSVRFG